MHAGGWEPCHSAGCCILWHRLCLGCSRDGHGIFHAQGARTAGLGVAPRGWQEPDSCAMALVVASAHGPTLAFFLFHQPQGPGHQPAWDCAQCQDAAVRVSLTGHRGVLGQWNSLRPTPDQLPFSPLTSSCPVMLVVGDNAPAEEGVVSDGAVPAGWQAGDAHAWWAQVHCLLRHTAAPGSGSVLLVCRPACSCGHLCTCSCMWLPHLKNFPFFMCPDVLTLCTLGCVGT